MLDRYGRLDGDLERREELPAFPAMLRQTRSCHVPDPDLGRPVTIVLDEVDEHSLGGASPMFETRIAETERQAQELASQTRADAEALVRAAETDRDRAREQAEQHRQAAQGADQRAAAAEARAEDARAETAQARENAARELEQLRADAARERDELRAALESRAHAQVLEESRGELRARAERTERGPNWPACAGNRERS